ncbi:MAG: PHP domain-containing protein [Clostridia bacterium]|nr:PHP domain-containing protein [Clostridia bacterium]
MSFLFDTHIHTKESSACGEVRAADIVARYKSLGYDGIIVTDHMQKKGIDRFGGTYEENIGCFLKGYHACKALADEKFKVILGMEIRFLENDNDYLVYGFDEDFLYSRDLAHIPTLEDFMPIAKENGLAVFQAHPFRNDMVIMPPDIVDGIEVYNGHGNHDSRNDIAWHWAEKFGFRKLSGSDFHGVLTMEPGGVYFEDEINDSKDVAKALLSNKYSLKVFTE